MTLLDLLIFVALFLMVIGKLTKNRRASRDMVTLGIGLAAIWVALQSFQ